MLLFYYVVDNIFCLSVCLGVKPTRTKPESWELSRELSREHEASKWPTEP